MRSTCRKPAILPILVLLFLPGALQPLAQTPNRTDSKSVNALFEKAAAKHKRELKDLRNTRALPPIWLPDVTVERLAAVLAKETNAYSAGYLPKTAILFYSYDDSALSTWLVDVSGIRAYDRQALSQEQIGTVISNVRQSLGVETLQIARTARKSSTPLVPEKKIASIPVNPAMSAATKLLLPRAIAAVLPAVDHLIVVPILGIGTVPFAALQPFGPDSFLIDEMSISIAPSLFDMGHHITDWNPEFSSPLILGNPFVAPGSGWVVPDLPGAAREAEAVAAALGSKALLGKDATRQAVVEKIFTSDFLYFAAHGIASSDDPLSGGFLLLSGESFEDGKITAKQVQGTSLPGVKIVVLSACQTGLGKVHDAGVIGLARAFQIAGAERVIMSLWNVNDEATNELMQEFIKHMRSDVPSEALRKAMIDIRRNRPNPSNWASFVVFGTPR